MKLFFAFIIDKPQNPLKQGISSNFKPRRKITDRGNFPRPRERKARQAIIWSVQDHSLGAWMNEKREWSIQAK